MRSYTILYDNMTPQSSPLTSHASPLTSHLPRMHLPSLLIAHVPAPWLISLRVCIPAYCANTHYSTNRTYIPAHCAPSRSTPVARVCAHCARICAHCARIAFPTNVLFRKEARSSAIKEKSRQFSAILRDKFMWEGKKREGFSLR